MTAEDYRTRPADSLYQRTRRPASPAGIAGGPGQSVRTATGGAHRGDPVGPGGIEHRHRVRGRGRFRNGPARR